MQEDLTTCTVCKQRCSHFPPAGSTKSWSSSEPSRPPLFYPQQPLRVNPGLERFACHQDLPQLGNGRSCKQPTKPLARDAFPAIPIPALHPLMPPGVVPKVRLAGEKPARKASQFLQRTTDRPTDRAGGKQNIGSFPILASRPFPSSFHLRFIGASLSLAAAWPSGKASPLRVLLAQPHRPDPTRHRSGPAKSRGRGSAGSHAARRGRHLGWSRGPGRIGRLGERGRAREPPIGPAALQLLPLCLLVRRF